MDAMVQSKDQCVALYKYQLLIPKAVRTCVRRGVSFRLAEVLEEVQMLNELETIQQSLLRENLLRDEEHGGR